uniref:VWFA domain-containing protein n=1 Tax=Mycena chlorophos TaxID=658473 RepID=A0ABQ0LC02_MYCCL|nr:predicted protein [Mycena chlorophos]
MPGVARGSMNHPSAPIVHHPKDEDEAKGHGGHESHPNNPNANNNHPNGNNNNNHNKPKGQGGHGTPNKGHGNNQPNKGHGNNNPNKGHGNNHPNQGHGNNHPNKGHGNGNGIEENMPKKKPKRSDIDVIFVHDATGSQKPYLDAATQESRNYVLKLSDGLAAAKNPGTLRFRVIAFRDHTDAWTVHETNPFTSDPTVLEKQFRALRAAGGGDGPEAQREALMAALHSKHSHWRKNAKKKNAKKLVFLITDAPPHGVEPGDHRPRRKNPILTSTIVDGYRREKIKLFVFGCVPTINRYRNAVSFYKKLIADIGTGGVYTELAVSHGARDAGRMSRGVIGHTLRVADEATIEERWEDFILDKNAHGFSFNAIVAAMYKKLHAEGETCHEVSCPHSGDHAYHKAPITRERVEDIVRRVLGHGR